jgi:hypothetical protein
MGGWILTVTGIQWIKDNKDRIEKYLGEHVPIGDRLPSDRKLKELLGSTAFKNNNLVHVRVIETPPPPGLPDGLSFENPSYHLTVNKEKTLILWLKNDIKRDDQIIAEITSDHSEIVIKSGGKCELRETDIPGVLIGKCRVLGRQLNARGEITARLRGFEPAKTRVVVGECEPVSGVKLKFKPVEDDFGAVRYKWDDKDPYLLNVGAKHPSIRKYLGAPNEQTYPGINSPFYHMILAEVIAEALAFRILEKLFKREGQDGMLDYASTDAYYNRHFSEFLSIAHRNLVGEENVTNQNIES